MAGAEGYLEVVSAGVGVEVEQFAHQIQPFHKAAFHGLGVHFAEGHAPLGDDGLVPVVGAGEG